MRDFLLYRLVSVMVILGVILAVIGSAALITYRQDTPTAMVIVWILAGFFGLGGLLILTGTLLFSPDPQTDQEEDGQEA